MAERSETYVFRQCKVIVPHLDVATTHTTKVFSQQRICVKALPIFGIVGGHVVTKHAFCDHTWFTSYSSYSQERTPNQRACCVYEDDQQRETRYYRPLLVVQWTKADGEDVIVNATFDMMQRCFRLEPELAS